MTVTDEPPTNMALDKTNNISLRMRQPDMDEFKPQKNL
jgi:hypothetical protein